MQQDIKLPRQPPPITALLRRLLYSTAAGLNVFANPSDGIASHGRQRKNEDQRGKHYFFHTSILELSRLKDPANQMTSSTRWFNAD